MNTTSLSVLEHKITSRVSPEEQESRYNEYLNTVANIPLSEYLVKRRKFYHFFFEFMKNDVYGKALRKADANREQALANRQEFMGRSFTRSIFDLLTVQALTYLLMFGLFAKILYVLFAPILFDK